MPTDITTSASIEIKAPATHVWKALTTPELIERWFFGARTETDWREGSPIVHRGEFRGRPYEDKGTILRVEPESLLVHTHWSSISGTPDAPENYQEVEWSLAEHDDDTTDLTVSETNVPSEQAKELSERAWEASLRALKDLLEP